MTRLNPVVGRASRSRTDALKTRSSRLPEIVPPLAQQDMYGDTQRNTFKRQKIDSGGAFLASRPLDLLSDEIEDEETLPRLDELGASASFASKNTRSPRLSYNPVLKSSSVHDVKALPPQGSSIPAITSSPTSTRSVILVPASSPFTAAGDIDTVEAIPTKGTNLQINPGTFYHKQQEAPRCRGDPIEDNGPIALITSSDEEAKERKVDERKSVFFSWANRHSPNSSSTAQTTLRSKTNPHGADSFASLVNLPGRQGLEDKSIEDSPLKRMRRAIGPFQFNHTTSGRPGRLDSLSSPRPSISGASLVNSYGNSSSAVVKKAGETMQYRRLTQGKPSKAKPVGMELGDIPEIDYRQNVMRMIDILGSTRTIDDMYDALKTKKNRYDDAMDFLMSKDADVETIDLTKGNNSDDDGPKELKSYSKNTKRAPKFERVAISTKWSSTQSQVPGSRLHPSVGESNPAAEKKKRRLIQRPASTRRDDTISSVAPPKSDVSRDLYSDDESNSAEESSEENDPELEARVLQFLNESSARDLSELASTSVEYANEVVLQRPFPSLKRVRLLSIESPSAKNDGLSRRGRNVGERIVEACLETFVGYDAVDNLITSVERLGKPIESYIKMWPVDTCGKSTSIFSETTARVKQLHLAGTDSGIGTTPENGLSDDDIHCRTAETAVEKLALGSYISKQPQNMGHGMKLKDYQMVGLNWLKLLYDQNVSCILADEMGLGKTCQVIAFLGYLLENGNQGPHLVVVPSSTLENWLREFQRFCPALKVEPYYGLQKERVDVRNKLTKTRGQYNVIVTTYNLATSSKADASFLRSLGFNCCVYDEGHKLKNSASATYDQLMRLKAQFRLILTGTPLQNNLQELVSLLAFILPSVFRNTRGHLNSIFRHKATTSSSNSNNQAMLSQQRIQRAKQMMQPFVLRRRKAEVLQDMPAKVSTVVYCDMSNTQKKIYDAELQLAARLIKARQTKQALKPGEKTTTNLLMQLRKASLHPLLFRNLFDDRKILKMSHDIIKEPELQDRVQSLVLEDMSVMTDFELNELCASHPKTLGKYTLDNLEWMDSGKIDKLKDILLSIKADGHRALVFSQFTQVLDILQMVLATLNIIYLRLDGQTPVDARQDLIDQFSAEEDVTVFLLSTNAGGQGLNLAAANRVIIFDLSMNPQMDRQAEDRAHRVGQERDVEVIRLVTRGSIEENILALANTKLALDESISGETVQKRAEGLVLDSITKGFELIDTM